MEPGIWRALFTVFMFLAFMGVVLWAWSSRRKNDFVEAAHLPLENDEFETVDGVPTGKVPQGDERS